MLKINLIESTNLAFEMIVEGTSSTVDQAWIVLETPHGYDIRLPAKYQDNQIRCAFPVLEGIMLNGTAKLHLEVIIAGRYFRPVSEEVQVGSGQQEVCILSKQAPKAPGTAQPAAEQDFSESLGALDKLKEKYAAATVEEFQFGKRFDEAFAQKKNEHAQKMRDARALAGALLGDVNGKINEDKQSMDRLKRLLNK